MLHTQSAVTLSVRVPKKTRNHLEKLAVTLGKSKSSLATEAIDGYLSVHAWQVKEIKKTIKKANSKRAKFVDHKKVVNWLSSWGNQEEQDFFK